MFINTAIRHAQIDRVNNADVVIKPKAEELKSVADEKEDELNKKYDISKTLKRLFNWHIIRIEKLEDDTIENHHWWAGLEDQELTTAWMNLCLQTEACYYHGTTKLNNETISTFIEKYGEDLPINELSEEKQVQILDIRRKLKYITRINYLICTNDFLPGETNKLLKEQFSSEKNEFEAKRVI